MIAFYKTATKEIIVKSFEALGFRYQFDFFSNQETIGWEASDSLRILNIYPGLKEKKITCRERPKNPTTKTKLLDFFQDKKEKKVEKKSIIDKTNNKKQEDKNKNRNMLKTKKHSKNTCCVVFGK